MWEERQEVRARGWGRGGDKAERGRAVLGAEGKSGCCRCGFLKDGVGRREVLVDMAGRLCGGAEGRPGEVERCWCRW